MVVKKVGTEGLFQVQNLSQGVVRHFTLNKQDNWYDNSTG